MGNFWQRKKNISSDFLQKTKVSFWQSRVEFKIMFIKLILIVACILSGLFLLKVLLTGFYSIVLIIAAVISLVSNLIMILMIRKKFFIKNLSFLISLYMFAFQAVLLETARDVIENDVLYSKRQIYFHGLLGNIFSGISLICPVEWWIVMIQNLIIQIMLLSRILNQATEEISFPEITGTVLLFYFLSIFIKYKSEAYAFHTFFLNEEKNKKLQFYKSLIEDLLPSPLLIVGEDSLDSALEIHLVNKFFKTFFRVSTNRSVTEILHDCLTTELQNSIEVVNVSTSIAGKYSRINLLSLIKSKLSNLKLEEFCVFQISLDLTITQERVTENVSLLGEEVINKSFEIPFELKIGRITWNSSPSVVVLFTDLSHAKKINDLQFLHQSKDRLLATVSHELRTPLNGIIGMVDMAKDQVHDKSLKKKLLIAVNAGKSLLYMINDILDISQISKGVLRVRFERVRLADVIDQVLALMKFQVKKKGLKLIKKIKCEESIFIYVDPLRLQQIIINLIGNSLKFTNQGSITLSIKQSKLGTSSKESLENVMSKMNTSDSSPSHQKVIIFSVKDTGSGIKEENIHRLFNLFATFEERGNNPTGVGLGLAISQKLAEGFFTDNRGGIRVKSKLGVGSKFWFPVLLADEELLPFEEYAHVPEIPFFSQYSPHVTTKTISGERDDASVVKILLVDDDLFNHSVIENYIKEFKGCVYEGASNGVEAIKKIILAKSQRQYYDMVMLDTNMPLMNGFETAIKINEMIMRGEIRPLHIASYTANPNDYKTYKDLVSEKIHIINKPIFLEEFRLKLEEIFKRPIGSKRKKK
jgi:signal transduction histidine kinase/CheY-like chemotaxis protein